MRRLIVAGGLFFCAILGAAVIMAFSQAKGEAVPVGTIIAWAGEAQSVPPGWALCYGQSLKRGRYPELFAAIGTSWGGQNSKRFNLPDLRGRFIRGADAGSGRDPDADKREASRLGGNETGVGSVQDDSFQNHSHWQQPHSHLVHMHGGALKVTEQSMGPVVSRTHERPPEASHDAKAEIRGASKYGTSSPCKTGEETRPKNAGVSFIIKIK